MTKLIVYELNEVPWRVIDLYLKHRPNSNLGEYLKKAAKLTTLTHDSGELHPWSTWPTMHRGVTNADHQINYINQDLQVAVSYPPIWQILSDNGVSVGIFGALQSFPPVASDLSLFHVPDTFAPSDMTHPRDYQAFQRLNLRLTGDNSARSGKIGVADIFAGASLLSRGLRLTTSGRLAAHLVLEKINPKYRNRRPTLQAPVSFDLYVDALERFKPRYSSFFTNHVAGIMHRYWKYSFPEDFSSQESVPDKFHSKSLVKAMDIFDRQLGKLMRFSKVNGYDLLVASSMGQEAIDRGEYIPELKLIDADLLAKNIGFDKGVKMNLAMQPDVAFEFENSSDLEEFERRVSTVTDLEGERVLYKRYPACGKTLNLSTRRCGKTAEARALNVRGVRFELEALGFTLIQRDPGTGYHQPRGILLWCGDRKPLTCDRQVVDSRQFAPTVLERFGISAPSYMLDPIL